jgi:hypothetical protein
LCASGGDDLSLVTKIKLTDSLVGSREEAEVLRDKGHDRGLSHDEFEVTGTVDDWDTMQSLVCHLLEGDYEGRCDLNGPAEKERRRKVR